MSKDFYLEGLHHVLLAIPAGGEEDCRFFYGQVLGMTELAKPTELATRGGCWFKGGNVELHLGVEKEFRPAMKAHPAILVDDISALETHLTKHGVPVTWDGNFPGYHRFYVEDPFNNRIEILQLKED